MFSTNIEKKKKIKEEIKFRRKEGANLVSNHYYNGDSKRWLWSASVRDVKYRPIEGIGLERYPFGWTIYLR